MNLFQIQKICFEYKWCVYMKKKKKKTFKVSPKAVTAAIELDERFDFQ